MIQHLGIWVNHWTGGNLTINEGLLELITSVIIALMVISWLLTPVSIGSSMCISSLKLRTSLWLLELRLISWLLELRLPELSLIPRQSLPPPPMLLLLLPWLVLSYMILRFMLPLWGLIYWLIRCEKVWR